MKQQKEQIFTRPFLLLCLSSFLFFSSFNMIIPELPDFLAGLGGSAYIGWIIGLFTLAALISRPISGKLADQIGRKPVMIIGVLVALLCSLIYPFLAGVVGFLVLRFFHGFCTGFHPTGVAAYMSDIVSFKNRGVAMGIYGLSTSFGFAAGPVIGSAVTLHYSIETLFYTSAAFALLSVLVIFSMPEPLKNRISIRKFNPIIQPRDLFEPRVIAPVVVMMLSVYAFGVVLTLIPDFSKELGLVNKGTFFSIFMISSLFVRIVAGRLSDVYGRERVLRLGLTLLIISMVLAAMASSLWVFYASAVIYGLAIGINAPILFAWTIDLSEEEHRGRAMASLYMSLEFGIGSGAMISGWIYGNEISRMPLAFWLAAALGLLALLYSLFRKRVRITDQKDALEQEESVN